MDYNELTNGNLYFVRDEFYEYFPNEKLPTNKEFSDGKEHGRPCFYSLRDVHTDIYWLVPISSKVAKYKTIYQSKLEKYKSVDTLIFGFVLGKERAFLIQNIFPITLDFISNVYIDLATNEPVKINEKTREEVDMKTKKVISFERKGIKLAFSNIVNMEKRLLDRLSDITREAAVAIQQTQEER